MYLVWNLQGHVSLRFTNAGGANAVLSGIFFDPTTAAPPMATSTLLVGAPNPAVAGASVTLTASVSGNAPSGSVSFTENGNPIGCAAATLAVGNPSSGSCSLSSLAVGTHSIVASYSGDPANLASTSPVLSQAITAPTASCAPEIVIDNLPPGAAGSSGVGEVSFTGNWAQSGASGGYGDNGSLYSFDDVSVPDAYTWRTPVLSSTQSCTYAVYVWWTTHPNRSVSVPITVSGQTSAPSTQSYNQQLNGSQWVLHGSYTFAPGARASVQVTNAGGQAAADAVRFVLDGSVGNLSSWNMFGRDAQHTAVSTTASQPLNRIHWQTPMDLQPQYTGTSLLIHYGSPLVTSANTVIVPVKTGATGGFRWKRAREATAR